jgi:hypothetical protein
MGRILIQGSHCCITNFSKCKLLIFSYKMGKNKWHFVKWLHMIFITDATKYRVILNDCSRSRPYPCYYIFAAFMWTVSFVAVTVIFYVKSAVMRFLFIFVKLTIESRHIKLFCTQFNSRMYSLIHIILMFFYVERQP